ncbi:MAG: chemotaxis protein CheW [Bryobacterales bacterium]|nr:chemotaxis protein CheW [Bryobacterales bacterium]
MTERKRLDFDRAKEHMARAQQTIEMGLQGSDDVAQLYRRRAELLARVPESMEASQGEDILVFRLGDARYAIAVAAIGEVIPRPKLAPTPGSPTEIAGLLQVRGEIRVVWDLWRLLGLTATPDGARTVLLLRSGRGVLVQEVEDLRRVDPRQRREAADKVPYRMWMTEDFVVVLDAEGMIAGEQQG